MISDIALVPCGASPADAWALAQTLDVVEEAQTLRPELLVRVVVTRKRNTGIGLGARTDLANAGVPVLPVELGERVAYQQAIGQGRGVTTLAKGTPAAREVSTLANHLLALKENGHDQTSIAHVA